MVSERRTSNTVITIPQPVEKVWETINNFHDLSWCPNVVSECLPLDEISGDATGSKRLVNNAFYERLRAYNSDVHFIGYMIEDGPPPISTDELKDIHVQIKLNPMAGSQTEVAFSVTSSAAENLDSVNFCVDNCVAMFLDLKKTLG